jgi:hypothetical protein
MKRMTAFSNHCIAPSVSCFPEKRGGRWQTKRTVVAGKPAIRTCAVELDATDSTYIVVRNVPVPACYCIPFFDFDFHDGRRS